MRNQYAYGSQSSTSAEEDPNTDLAAAIEAGVHAADAATRLVHVGEIPVAIVPKSMEAVNLQDVLEEADKRAPAPSRKRGESTHEELESFCAHVNRHKDADSVIFAQVEKVKLLAVYDYNRGGPEGAPRWGQHRAIYTCPLSRQWKLWTEKNSKRFGRVAFGDFIEANLSDLASASQASGAIPSDMPAPADVLSMARDLRVLTNANYSRTINRTTGESELISKTENNQTSTKIPRAFLLQLPVFEGGEMYAVEARVRFEMVEGAPTFTYVLFEPERILKDAFGSVRARVAKETALPVFAGSPE